MVAIEPPRQRNQYKPPHDSRSICPRPIKRRVVNVPYKRQTPVPIPEPPMRKPVAEQEPDTECNIRQDSYVKRAHEIKLPAPKQHKTYFKNLPKFDFENQKLIEKSDEPKKSPSATKASTKTDKTPVKPSQSSPESAETKAENVSGDNYTAKDNKTRETISKVKTSPSAKSTLGDNSFVTVTGPTPAGSSTAPFASKEQAIPEDLTPGQPQTPPQVPQPAPSQPSSSVSQRSSTQQKRRFSDDSSGNTNGNAIQSERRRIWTPSTKANQGTFVWPKKENAAFQPNYGENCVSILHART